MKLKKKILSLLLCAVMLFGLVPTVALAEGETQYTINIYYPDGSYTTWSATSTNTSYEVSNSTGDFLTTLGNAKAELKKQGKKLVGLTATQGGTTDQAIDYSGARFSDDNTKITLASWAPIATLYAVTEELPINISVSAVPEGSGIVSGGGYYDTGEDVTLQATPNTGYRFVEWRNASGNRVDTDSTYTFKASTSQSFVAVFRATAASVSPTTLIWDKYTATEGPQFTLSLQESADSPGTIKYENSTGTIDDWSASTAEYFVKFRDYYWTAVVTLDQNLLKNEAVGTYKLTFVMESGVELSATLEITDSTPTFSFNTQPKGETYTVGDAATNLHVAWQYNNATVSSVKTTWYSNTTNNTTGGTVVSESTNIEYTGDYTPSTDTAGITYYYCTVEIGYNGANQTTITSDVAEIVVNEKEKKNAAVDENSISYDKATSQEVTIKLFKGSYNFDNTSGTIKDENGTKLTMGIVSNGADCQALRAGGSGDSRWVQYKLSNDYLNSLSKGTHTLTFEMDGGTNPTVTITVSDSKNRTELDVSHMKWDTTGSPFTYDGTQKSITLTGTLPEGVEVGYSRNRTGIYVFGSDDGARTATATFMLADGYSSDNYVIVGKNPISATWYINKAAALTLTKNVSHTCKETGEKAVSVAGLMPANANIIGSGVKTSYAAGEKTDVHNIISSWSVDSSTGKVTYTLAGQSSYRDGLTATLPVKITTLNYEESTVNVVVTLTNEGGSEDKQYTVEIPVSVEVKKGGIVGAPAESFDIEAEYGKEIDDSLDGAAEMKEMLAKEVKIETSGEPVATNGAGEYTEAKVKVSFTETAWQALMADGSIHITQKSGSTDGWKYDASSYHVYLEQKTDGSYGIKAYEVSNGTVAEPIAAAKVVFTNTYTKNTTPTPVTPVTEKYTITAEAGTGGTISPTGSADVAKGGSQTFTIAANDGYKISDVKVDGVSVGAVTSYTFTDVKKAHTIEAAFEKTETTNPTNPTTPTEHNKTTPDTGKGTTDVNVPQTGDSSNLALWIGLLALAAAGLTGTVIYGRKHKYSE